MGIMSNFGRVFGGKSLEEKSLSKPDAVIEAIFSGASSSQASSITASNAMRVPAVRRAVVLISEAVSTLPFKIYGSNKETAETHPGFRLVHGWANDWTAAETLREQVTVDALLTGNGFAEIVRTFEGKPVEMHRIPPGRVSVEYDEFGEPSYVVQGDTGARRLAYTEVLHIAALGGVSPVVQGRTAINLAIAAEEHLSGFFQNGGRPSGIIKHPAKLEAEAMRKLSASWFKSHGGSNSGSTAILDEGMDFKEISTKLADAEFSEVRREEIREIARAFNVPPALLYELSRGTWSNFEQSYRDFLTGTLRPWISRWENAYTRALIPSEDRSEFYIEAVVDDLLSVDFSARATALGQYSAMKALTPNDVRATMNKPPISGGDSLENPYTTSSN